MVLRTPRAGGAVAGLVALAFALPTTGSEQAGHTLDEVEVTAQRRVQDSQHVPASVAVVTGRDLDADSLDSLDEIALRTPDLVMSRFNVGEPQLYIRGIGSNSDSAASDPSVGVFLDDVYVGRQSGAAFDLLDLERVEVLRGPQNALFGRNTSSGAIRLISRQPDDTPGARLSLDAGNYALRAGTLIANAPLGDTLAARLALRHRERDGYSRNIVTGEDLGGERTSAARLNLLHTPREGTRLRAGFDWQRDRNGGNARVPGPVFLDHTGAEALATAALLRLWSPGDDPRRSHADPDTFQRRSLLGGVLRAEQDAGSGTWTAIGSARRTRLSWHEDLDGLKPFGLPPLPGVPQPALGWVNATQDSAREHADQHSLELRYAAQGARTGWQAGVYYFAEQVDRREDFVSRSSLVPATSGDVSFLQDVDSRSYSAYAGFSTALHGAWRLNVNGRIGHDEKDIRQQALNNDPTDPTPGQPLFPGQPYDVAARANWTPLTGSAALEYAPREGRFFYASIGRGFKAGAFPSQNNVLQNVGVATPAERVASLEVGTRTMWLENRLRANATAFVTHYEDLQLFRLDPALRLLTFTENARIRGVEAELAVRAHRSLELGVNGALLDGRIRGGANDDDRLPRAPKLKYTAFVDARQDLPLGQLALRVNWQWSDHYEMDVPNSRTSHVPAHGLLGASLRWNSADARFGVSFWGKNLTDRLYATNTITFLGNGFSIYGPPRTWGVTLDWNGD